MDHESRHDEKQPTVDPAQVTRFLRLIRGTYGWDDIVGIGPAMEKAKTEGRRAAAGSAPILMRGEPGTGKSLFASAVHLSSDRANERFIRVACRTGQPDTLEGDLFGLGKGALGGGLRAGRRGVFETAGGGTVFLDEIGDLDPAVQGKLLRVLRGRESVPPEGENPVAVDVRVIAASSANLEDKVAEGSFHEELFQLLNVSAVHIPPLRQRGDDVRMLAEHIFFKLSWDPAGIERRLSPPVLDALNGYGWPGNAVELERVLAWALMTMGPGDAVVEPGHLPPLFPYGGDSRFLAAGPLDSRVAEAERRAIVEALEQAGGNRTQTASVLAISLRTLYYKMKKYGLK